ncbi:MAG: hypothetical protein HY553_08490 [Elusimicrobia bacterium]|nr:hypothetical protein [Elusimicrobiota bacterium]
MRSHRAAVCLAIVVAVAAGVSAEGPEALKASGESWAGAGFAATGLRHRFEKAWSARPPQRPPRKLFETPRLYPFQPGRVNPLIGSFKLAERLDIHRALFNKQLGALAWDISMASDSEFKVQYLTLTRPQTLLIKRIDDLNRLRGEGVVVSIDGQTHYRAKVSISIFNPVRGSTLNLDPVNGTRGPSHKIKTGEILDRVKANSYVFRANGKEFWLLYGTDVDPKTDRLAGTRSLLFVHEAGLDSKAWPVGESQLAPDAAVGVDLGGTKIAVTRGSDGILRIHGR